MLTEISLDRCSAHRLGILVVSVLRYRRSRLAQFSDIISFDRILALWKFDLLTFNGQVCAKDPSCYLPAVLAVADVPSSLLAEEIVVIDLHGYCFA